MTIVIDKRANRLDGSYKEAIQAQDYGLIHGLGVFMGCQYFILTEFSVPSQATTHCIYNMEWHYTYSRGGISFNTGGSFSTSTLNFHIPAIKKCDTSSV